MYQAKCRLTCANNLTGRSVLCSRRPRKAPRCHGSRNIRGMKITASGQFSTRKQRFAARPPRLNPGQELPPFARATARRPPPGSARRCGTAPQRCDRPTRQPAGRECPRSAARTHRHAGSRTAYGPAGSASQRRAASTSCGLGVSRRGGLHAHLRNASRRTTGSGAPRWDLTSTGVTAISPSASETRPLPACFGQRASMNSDACANHVTWLISRARESGRPESTSNASPLSAAWSSHGGSAAHLGRGPRRGQSRQPPPGGRGQHRGSRVGPCAWIGHVLGGLGP